MKYKAIEFNSLDATCDFIDTYYKSQDCVSKDQLKFMIFIGTMIMNDLNYNVKYYMTFNNKHNELFILESKIDDTFKLQFIIEPFLHDANHTLNEGFEIPKTLVSLSVMIWNTFMHNATSFNSVQYMAASRVNLKDVIKMLFDDFKKESYINKVR